MKITGEKGIGNILKMILEICFCGGVFLLAALPFVLNLLGMNLNASMFVIYPNGTVLLVITYKFIKLFDSLKNNNPFSEENVKILKRTGIVSLIGSFFWLIDFLYQTILVKDSDVGVNITLFFLFILFFGVAIALYILSELFKQAYEYKKENDLTI